MGLLKWLKRDMSPASNRRVSAPPTTANKLTRNESYLKALSKFNKWRQMHLAVDCPNTKYNKKLSKSFNSFNQTTPNNNNDEHLSNISSEEDSDASQMIYEEIDLNSREPKCVLNNSKKFNCTGERVLAPLDNSLLQSTNYENKSYHRRYYNSNVENIVNSCDSNNHQNDDYQRVLDESEYALPYSNCSTNSSAEIYEKYIERNFAILTPKAELSECQEESRGRLMITDLDKSQETVATFEENCTQAEQIHSNNVSSSDNIDFFSELMICPLACIDVDMEESGFNITNGFIQHGEIDSVEISYIQMKENYRDAIYNSFATLRKLRHPNIILLMGVSMDESSILEALITEPLKCTLYDSIHFEKNRISLESCHRYALEITNALIYLHKHEIIHSNICSQNIILCRATGTVKLGGFELNISAKNIMHENDKSAEPSSPNSKMPRQQYLPQSVEYRKRYTQHFYQAPELLTDSKEYIQPTYQSDVYGICITLWEMLNCVIPYLQFSCIELIKVFSLKNAQLPAFEEERCLPFKDVLENGLQIQMDCRIPNAVLLKSKLKQVKFNQNGQQNELGLSSADKSVPHDIHSITKLSHYKDLHYTPYERTSTIKKRKTAAKLNRAGPMHPECNNFEEPCSPITRATILNWSTENNTESICAQKVSAEQMQILNDRNKLNMHDDAITPNRKFSVNILIKSKGSPSLSPFQNNMNDSPKMNNVKEKINKFESFLTSSPSFNRFGDSSVRSEEKLANNCESNIENNIKVNYKNNFCTLDKENENPFAKLQFRLISTEDLYIDDDFQNDCNLGANFELDFNYVDDNFT